MPARRSASPAKNAGTADPEARERTDRVGGEGGGDGLATEEP